MQFFYNWTYDRHFLLPAPKIEATPPEKVRFSWIFMKLCKGDLLVNILKYMEWIFDNFCPTDYMTDFLNLLGRLDPPPSPTLKNTKAVIFSKQQKYAV